jgi:hypothetical protein
MKTTPFFISGTCADCQSFFKEDYVLLSIAHIVNLLTKAAVYNLYISETYEEAKTLGDCIYQFNIPTEILEDNKGLFQYTEQKGQFVQEIPVKRIQ